MARGGGSAALFAAMHLEPIRFALLFAIGLILGAARIHRNNTSTAIVAHMTNNLPGDRHPVPGGLRSPTGRTAGPTDAASCSPPVARSWGWESEEPQRAGDGRCLQ